MPSVTAAVLAHASSTTWHTCQTPRNSYPLGLCGAGGGVDAVEALGELPHRFEVGVGGEYLGQLGALVPVEAV